MRSIASATFKNFFRNKLLQVFFFVSLFFVLISIFVSQLALSEMTKVFTDFSLASIEIFGVIVILFFGGYILDQEIKNKTFHLLYAKSKNIYHILWGKFFGFTQVLLLYVFLLGIVYAILSLILGVPLTGIILLSILFIFLKLLGLLALLLFFSTFMSPLVSLFCGLIIYLISHSLPFLVYTLAENNNIFFSKVMMILYYLFPNFSQLSLNEYLISPFFSELTVVNIFALIFSHIIYILLILSIGGFILKSHKSFD